MLLGVAGFVKGDWLNVTEDQVKMVSDNGFVSALLTISDPSAGDDRDIENIKSLYAAHGLNMPMTRGAYGGGLCSDDEDQRKWTVKFLEDTIQAIRQDDLPHHLLPSRKPQPERCMVAPSRKPFASNL